MFRSAMFKSWRSGISLFVVAAFLLNTTASHAQSTFVATLPEPGAMVSTSQAFVPVLVKGLVIHPEQPLNFDFIVDSGNDSPEQSVIKEQSERMAQYFLAAITVPEEQLWVNLSPYENDRVVEEDLGRTVLGRDMLAQDYILKQLTASLIYPEKGIGKDFWDRVYKEADKKFGTTDIQVNTYNKVWIMPETAEVYEKNSAVYVTQAKLKVMLDSDYVAAKSQESDAPADQELSKQIMREVVIPAIEREVNEGKNFAVIRQIYHAAILAKWYREQIQNTLLADAYMGKNKVVGIEADEQKLKEEIYDRYIAAYKKGVFNLIKDETTADGESLPRKYFSGGISDLAMSRIALARSAFWPSETIGETFKINLAMMSNAGRPHKIKPADEAMTVSPKWLMSAMVGFALLLGLEAEQTNNQRETQKQGNQVRIFDSEGKDALTAAAAEGDVSRVKAMIENGAAVDSRDLSNRTALHHAAANGQAAVVDLLISKGANIHAVDEKGYTPLTIAARYGRAAVVKQLLAAYPLAKTKEGEKAVLVASYVGNDEVLKALLDAKANVNAVTPDGFTALLMAVRGDNVSTAKLLLSYKADVNKKIEGQGGAALTLAVAKKNVAMVELLLNNGADVNSVEDEQGLTPLMTAARMESGEEILEMLLVKKAQVNVRNKQGATALHIAAQGGQSSYVSKLLQYGADIEAPTDKRVTPLMAASMKDQTDVIKLLLAKGANIEKKDVNGWTSLVWACHVGRVKAAQELLSAKADINNQAHDGASPLYVASVGGHDAVVKLLIENGANLNVRLDTGVTPLMSAAALGRLSTVRLLIAAKADVNVKVNGWTALSMAKYQKLDAIVEALIQAGAKDQAMNEQSVVSSSEIAQNLSSVEHPSDAAVSSPDQWYTGPLWEQQLPAMLLGRNHWRTLYKGGRYIVAINAVVMHTPVIMFADIDTERVYGMRVSTDAEEDRSSYVKMYSDERRFVLHYSGSKYEYSYSSDFPSGADFYGSRTRKGWRSYEVEYKFPDEATTVDDKGIFGFEEDDYAMNAMSASLLDDWKRQSLIRNEVPGDYRPDYRNEGGAFHLLDLLVRNKTAFQSEAADIWEALYFETIEYLADKRHTVQWTVEKRNLVNKISAGVPSFKAGRDNPTDFLAEFTPYDRQRLDRYNAIIRLANSIDPANFTHEVKHGYISQYSDGISDPDFVPGIEVQLFEIRDYAMSVGTPRPFLHETPPDERLGGIDIQDINVERRGTSRLEFNDAAVREVLQHGFEGFTPVIINITPIASPLMIMGEAEPDEELETVPS